MSVKKDEVKYIAKLAKLYFDESELETMCKKIDNLVDFAHTLSELNTENLKPLSHVQGNENVFDEDVQGEHYNLHCLLKNAPESTDDYFIVPKVIE